MYRNSWLWMLSIVLTLSMLPACVPTPDKVVSTADSLEIYPDYKDITLPCNIAPLNFMMRTNCKAVETVVCLEKTGEEVLKINRKGTKIVFGEDDWKKLLDRCKGERLQVTVTVLQECADTWVKYPSFGWEISTDSIDRYLTYRLIEPGYEVWDKVCIEERCTESFETRMLADGARLGNRCMNCHTHGGDQGQYSFFHLRGEKGGTLLNRNGQLRKVTLKKEGMPSGAVYGDWHPSGRFGVFSTNVIIPAFHSLKSRRLEVYDTTSDLCVADFDRDSLLLPPLASGTPETLETFPAFSADGQWIYYCAAPNPCGDTVPSAASLVSRVDELNYSLCRMPFDAETGSFGDRVDTLYNARTDGGSANFPKCSPDGRFLAYCHSESGTFPIWHKETRLRVVPVGEPGMNEEELKGIHATYHSWSHNSKWLAFASKQYDGQYSRVYFVHLGENGSFYSKPFALPQADPEMDDWNLRSFNIPDLGNFPMPFGHDDVKIVLENVSSKSFK